MHWTGKDWLKRASANLSPPVMWVLDESTMTNKKLKIAILTYAWIICIAGLGIIFLGLYIVFDSFELFSLLLFMPSGLLLFLVGFNVIRNYSLTSIKTITAITLFPLLTYLADAIEQLVSK